MKFEKVITEEQDKAYINFVKTLYKGDPFYRDYNTPIMKEILRETSAFSKKLKKWAYLIKEDEKCVGGVMYLIHENYKDVVQVAFMEYTPHPYIAQEILWEAVTLARQEGASEVVVGLNGHVNYGLGISVDPMHQPTFGSTYSKPYYVQDLEAMGLQAVGLTTYQTKWEPVLPYSEARCKFLTEGFTYHFMSNQTFEEDVALYTSLNNKCFVDHPFYFPRTVEEDKELFKSLKYFMDKQSLIFIHHQGQPIGFMMWYPDWGEVMKPGETLGIKTYIKTKWQRKKVKTFKIVEWGVLPQYQGGGVPLALLYKCYEILKGRGFEKCKSSWILDSNLDSNSFCRKWAEPYETYKVYRMEVDKE